MLSKDSVALGIIFKPVKHQDMSTKTLLDQNSVGNVCQKWYNQEIQEKIAIVQLFATILTLMNPWYIAIVKQKLH